MSPSYTNPGGNRPMPVDVRMPRLLRAWNPTVSLTRDGSDNITLISETDGSVTYTQTLTWSGGVLTTIGPWVEP